MGPLEGIRIIEIAGIGPGPFCGMMLADMGAQVIRIDRAGQAGTTAIPNDVLNRGRKSVAVNLKSPAGKDIVLKLCEKADGLFEGFRPGVAERLGVGPEDCQKMNPKLVYGRMTGWGQDGPMALAAGHDINYISLSGALHAIGRAGERPIPPLNLVGDFGGGGMLLAFGMVCALLEARNSGKGQVVDAAMVDGSAALMAMFFTLRQFGMFKEERGTNMLDGGAHFYDTYETKDGKYVSIGSIEPQFYALLLEKTGVDQQKFGNQLDVSQWPALKEELTRVFKDKTQDQWCEIMEGTDVCFAPVLPISEAKDHPHNTARNTFLEIDGILQPGPAPRFSRTQAQIRSNARLPGQDSEEVLKENGFSEEEIASLKAAGDIS